MSNSLTPPTASPSAYCGQCGAVVNAGAAACLRCGFRPSAARNFCQRCGTAAAPGQAVCLSCGSGLSGATGSGGEKSKVAAGLLGILLGGFGAHKFYLGYNNAAVIMLVVTLVGFCSVFFFIGLLFVWVPSIVGLIEGIMYLTKSDDDFNQTYVVEKREWF